MGGGGARRGEANQILSHDHERKRRAYTGNRDHEFTTVRKWVMQILNQINRQIKDESGKEPNNRLGQRYRSLNKEYT
uniref:Uncharacterized protein n=1 Tax=Oryza rufipogon TaxID=4529 RepID=A0A0E0NJU1_ORYRU